MSHYVTESSELVRLCDRARELGEIGLDLEFIREKTYFPQLALIQIAVGDEYRLIDPLVELDREPLYALLDDVSVVKVLHAASQDLEILVAESGRTPRGIFDTQIAGALAGLGNQISYAAICERLLGVTVKKGESFTNWLARPLSPEQEDYALDDVRYLHGLRAALLERLESQGRIDWVAEEFSAHEDPATYAVDWNRLYTKVKRFGTLPPRGQMVLRELAIWREEVARRRDIPKRRVVSDETLIEIARSQPKEQRRLERIRGLHPKEAERNGRAILEAVQRGLEVPDAELPQRSNRNRLRPEEETLIDLAGAVMKALCASEEIATTMVATTREVESLYRHVLLDEPADDLRILQGWRRKLIGDPLIAFIRGERSVHVDAERRRVEIIDR